jgi:ABC-type nitrate/sulfonate/bicarbonate transport system permease component
MPLINILRPLPSSAIIPMAIIFLGIGIEMKLFIIVFGCSWPILINTIDGAIGLEPMFLRTSKILGFSNLERLKNVIIPATLPAIFTGLRISIAISFILTITVEMIVGTSGIGYFIIDKERSFRFPEMYGGILCLGILGIIINNVFNYFDRRINKWHYESK